MTKPDQGGRPPELEQPAERICVRYGADEVRMVEWIQGRYKLPSRSDAFRMALRVAHAILRDVRGVGGPKA